MRLPIDHGRSFMLTSNSVGGIGWDMLEEQFRKQRASLLRKLASEADPFIQKRLLDLAKRYDGPERRVTPVDLQITSPSRQATER